MSRNILPLSLPPEYRCVPCDDGYELQYMEPARYGWIILAVRDTVAEIMAAYGRILEGEQP